MATIKESFKQACPHCEGSRMEINTVCCGQTVHGYCCIHPIPEVSDCGMCYGTGVIEKPMAVRIEWLFPEISEKEFTL